MHEKLDIKPKNVYITVPTGILLIFGGLMRYIKKLIAITLVLAVSWPYAWAFEVVASSATQRELRAIESELRDIESQIEEESVFLQNLRRELQELRDELHALDTQIAQIIASISDTENTIAMLSYSIELVGKEREAAAYALEEARINREKGQEVLAARVRAMHESGQINILDVLFSAESFTDFLVRVEDLRTVIRFNRELIERLEEYENDYHRINEELFLLEARLQDLQRSYVSQHEMLAWQLDNLNYQLIEKNDFIVELEENEERFALLLELLEKEHYALIERGILVRERFDRELAAVNFNHAVRHLSTWTPPAPAQVVPAQPRVHTAPTFPGTGVGVATVNTIASLAALETNYRMLEFVMRYDDTTIFSDDIIAGFHNAVRNNEIRVSGAGGRFEWPVPSWHYVGRRFEGNDHPGIDVFGRTGASIVAAESGVVTHSAWSLGMGYSIIIDHGNGYKTAYIHNLRNHVSVGQQVSRGQHIADIGSTGPTVVCHLHFEIWRSNVPIDPMLFFR